MFSVHSALEVGAGWSVCRGEKGHLVLSVAGS